MATATVLVACAVTGGCTSGDPPGGMALARLAARRSAVIGGYTVIGNDNPNQVAYYRLGSDGVTWISRPCTATVLSEDWVLTARHCTRFPGTNVDIPVEWMALTDDLSPGINGPPAGSQVPTEVIRELGPDAALLRVNMFPNLGSLLTDTASVRVYNGALTNLSSAWVTAYGYGRSVCSDPSAPESPSYGAGTLREGEFQVVSLDASNIQYSLSSSTAELFSGDSGGASFLYSNGVQYLTGVHSIGGCQPLYPGDAKDTAIQVFHSWLQWNTQNVSQSAIITAATSPLR